MYKSFLFLTIWIVAFVKSQAPISHKIYFPDSDNGIFFQNDDAQPLSAPAVSNIPNNLTDLRGTAQYEEYVEEIISTGLIRLTLAINKVISSNSDPKENVVFSPVSIGAALSLILLGSNGKTFEEMVNVLGLAAGLDIQEKTNIVHAQYARIAAALQAAPKSNIEHQVRIATAIFVQEGYPIRPLYNETARSLYQSDIYNLNFKTPEATRILNNWVSERTHNKIKELFSEPPPPSSRVILASALYFNSLWLKPFLKGHTRRMKFYSNGKKNPAEIEVDMMANGGEFSYYKDNSLKCEIFALPYQDRETFMYVILPFDSDTTQVKSLQDNLTPAILEGLIGKMNQTGMILVMPKMKLETTINLKESLQAMGVKSLFDPFEANLALLSAGDNIKKSAFEAPVVKELETLDSIRKSLNQHGPNYQNPGLFADQVVHKVYMHIMETGTEAAATTAIGLSRAGGRAIVRLDAPFLFFIRHNPTKAVLFWGTVSKPTPNFKINA